MCGLFAVEFRPLEMQREFQEYSYFKNDVYKGEELNGFNNKHIPPYLSSCLKYPLENSGWHLRHAGDVLVTVIMSSHFMSGSSSSSLLL